MAMNKASEESRGITVVQSLQTPSTPQGSSSGEQQGG